MLSQIDTDYIRNFVEEAYVRPWARRRQGELVIPVRDVFDEMVRRGLPRGRVPMVCSALRGLKLLTKNHIEIKSIEGPPSQQSTTVVFHYVDKAEPGSSKKQVPAPVESSDEWAQRLTGRLKGLLRNEIQGMGGTEAFMRWVRSDDEEAA
ncbi:hypothetical protein [Terriglobus saanensis]|uniref:Uncharacterized protein n=1 Tax=Terriglobus saanensis (strain ATCC BAA-1853 / DSM 23119 / SP1PR4) TaxID=401053 RepID=E8UZF4_TERSS|nr:hypothetical protein [Terriglobus saanensis]ADV83234.1 hypothetical protein AciPR4_2454 [Terriglobus saanensis SP1PR4]